MSHGLRYNQNEKKKIKYREIINNGLCMACRKKREQKNKSRCNKCLKKNRNYQHNKRNMEVKNGKEKRK